MTRIRVLINGGISEEIDIDKPIRDIEFIDVVMRIKSKGLIMGWVEIQPDPKHQLMTNIEKVIGDELKRRLKGSGD